MQFAQTLFISYSSASKYRSNYCFDYFKNRRLVKICNL